RGLFGLWFCRTDPAQFAGFALLRERNRFNLPQPARNPLPALPRPCPADFFQCAGHAPPRFLICWQQNLSRSRARKNSSAWSIPSSTHSRSTRSFWALTSSFHVLALGSAGLAGLRRVMVSSVQSPACRIS